MLDPATISKILDPVAIEKIMYYLNHGGVVVTLSEDGKDYIFTPLKAHDAVIRSEERERIWKEKDEGI